MSLTGSRHPHGDPRIPTAEQAQRNEIPLGKGCVAVVDAEDYGRLTAFKWHAGDHRGRWYAYRNVGAEGRWTRVPMTHEVLGPPPPGQEIDHVDCNTLDNRKANLRLVTRQQNSANARGRGGTSRFKGVCWDASRGRWMAGVKVNYRRINIGRFDSEEEAARAYDAGAREAFGEFARTNFP